MSGPTVDHLGARPYKVEGWWKWRKKPLVLQSQVSWCTVWLENGEYKEVWTEYHFYPKPHYLSQNESP